jgi:hypothetical protein
MTVPQVDVGFLTRFEQGLDARCPEKSAIPARVLGYGEISTVLELGTGSDRDIAYKRLPMFVSEDEAIRYEAGLRAYVDVLQHRVGINVVPTSTVRVVDERSGRVVVYIAQEKLPAESIGHRAIHTLPSDGVERLVRAVLTECGKAFRFNREQQGEVEIGLDGQISNWGIVGHATGAALQGEPFALTYLDISTPFLRRDGYEHLDPELFLRSAPSFLVWILKLLFLEDVMTRYYDFRKVAVDIVANLIKEQRSEIVPAIVEVANRFLAGEIDGADFEPLSVKEVKSYYREDAWIWRSYLAARRIDRSLHRVLGKEYPFILPGRIKR